MPSTKHTYGDVTDVLSIDSTKQPLLHFAQGFTLHDSEWTEHENLQFHVSKSYAQYKDGAMIKEYNGRTYKYDVAIVPSNAYLQVLLDSMQGIYSVKLGVKNRIIDGSRKYEKENASFIENLSRLDASNNPIRGYSMKPATELEFIANYKAVNHISDDDYGFMPLYFIDSINSLFSRNLQRLQWAKTTSDDTIKSKQLNQFIADFIYVWNEPLISYTANKDSKILPTRTTVSNSVTNVGF